MPFVFGWLLNGIYLLILAAVSPLLIFRRLTKGKYRGGWQEKLGGRLTRQFPDRTCLWFHAVSVGEVLQLQTMLQETSIQFPNAEIFLTVTTTTGYDIARSKYPQHTVSYFPLDFSWAVHNALHTIRPDLIVLVELELWPNFILTARRLGIPLVLINGRMSERSFRGYARLKPLMRRLWSCFDLVAVQTEDYADRIRALGARPDQVIVTGNIKFDRVESDRGNSQTRALSEVFGIQPLEQVLIAGSTQEPEEAYALDAWLALRKEFPTLRLILVPRHQERFEEVAALIRQRGCALIRRSEHMRANSSVLNEPAGEVGRTMELGQKVGLLDTIGELSACWGLADIAFVGGSLTQRGGQNMIEPAGYGAAVLFGPNTWNFKDVTQALLAQNAARVVWNESDLLKTVRELLYQPATAVKMGQAAREFVVTQQGATRRTVDLISQVLASRSGEIPMRPQGVTGR